MVVPRCRGGLAPLAGLGDSRVASGDQAAVVVMVVTPLRVCWPAAIAGFQG
jgi:hypothetical protein